MQLINHFDMEESEFCIYRIKETELQVLLNKLPREFRQCYVKNEDLEELVQLTGSSMQDILKDNYIPENKSVMSGEFGEIFSYFLLKERYLPISVDGPTKWIWKDDKDQAIQKTDVMLFKQEDIISANDLVVSAEIKAKATKSSNNQLENAVNDMKKDNISRLAVSLKWLKSKYLKDKDIDNSKKLDRFLNPSEFGTYQKDFKAIVVIDSDLLEEEIEKYKRVEDINFDHEIIIFALTGLKNCYETTYEKILFEGESFDDTSKPKEMDNSVTLLENI
ncbi:DUF1837 domain-containing protein [Bacillus sp. N3536]|nr:DUF1837 domain-containing protein [Bacillus sp. N3536]